MSREQTPIGGRQAVPVGSEQLSSEHSAHSVLFEIRFVVVERITFALQVLGATMAPSTTFPGLGQIWDTAGWKLRVNGRKPAQPGFR